jgi:hypothetical protein
MGLFPVSGWNDTTEKITCRQKKRWKFRTQKVAYKFDESTASKKDFLAEKHLL